MTRWIRTCRGKDVCTSRAICWTRPFATAARKKTIRTRKVCRRVFWIIFTAPTITWMRRLPSSNTTRTLAKSNSGTSWRPATTREDVPFSRPLRIYSASLPEDYTGGLLRQRGTSEENFHQHNAAHECGTDAEQRADEEIFRKLFAMELRVARN